MRYQHTILNGVLYASPFSLLEIPWWFCFGGDCLETLWLFECNPFSIIRPHLWQCSTKKQQYILIHYPNVVVVYKRGISSILTVEFDRKHLDRNSELSTLSTNWTPFFTLLFLQLIPKHICGLDWVSSLSVLTRDCWELDSVYRLRQHSLIRWLRHIAGVGLLRTTFHAPRVMCSSLRRLCFQKRRRICAHGEGTISAPVFDLPTKCVTIFACGDAAVAIDWKNSILDCRQEIGRINVDFIWRYKRIHQSGFLDGNRTVVLVIL